MKHKGLPWPSSGEDSALPLQGARVQYLGRELRSHMPGGMVGSGAGIRGSLHVSKPRAHVIFIMKDCKE